jgi:hypothetical protein
MKINRRASILVLLVGIASPIRTAPIMAQEYYRGHDSLAGSIDGAKVARQIPDEVARCTLCAALLESPRQPGDGTPEQSAETRSCRGRR